MIEFSKEVLDFFENPTPEGVYDAQHTLNLEDFFKKREIFNKINFTTTHNLLTNEFFIRMLNKEDYEKVGICKSSSTFSQELYEWEELSNLLGKETKFYSKKEVEDYYNFIHECLIFIFKKDVNIIIEEQNKINSKNIKMTKFINEVKVKELEEEMKHES